MKQYLCGRAISLIAMVVIIAITTLTVQSTGSNSTDFDVEATIDNVNVSWWETNQTSAEPVIVFSGDRGATLGPVLRLASNGTISG